MRLRGRRKKQGFLDPSGAHRSPWVGRRGHLGNMFINQQFANNALSLESGTLKSCLWVCLQVSLSLSPIIGSQARLDPEYGSITFMATASPVFTGESPPWAQEAFHQCTQGCCPSGKQAGEKSRIGETRGAETGSCAWAPLPSARLPRSSATW